MIDDMHAYIVSLEAELKAPITTSCPTCELHAVKNLELAHYVDLLQDENDDQRVATLAGRPGAAQGGGVDWCRGGHQLLSLIQPLQDRAHPAFEYWG
jgi:hypothetical protein